MIATPLSNGSNGRDAKGRFLPGNAGGPGNPHAQRAVQLRGMIQACVTDADFRRVVKQLLKIALDEASPYQLAAIKELLDRLIGKPQTTEEIQEADGLSTNRDELIAQLSTRLKAFLTDSPASNN